MVVDIRNRKHRDSDDQDGSGKQFYKFPVYFHVGKAVYSNRFPDTENDDKKKE
jgi:hypothetical protein